MKFYIASRFFNKEQAQTVMVALQKKGHTVTADWTLHKDVRPYAQHSGIARAYSAEDMTGTLNCDVFALLTDGGTDGKGMHVELGAAIASQLLRGRPQVFVVGKNNADSLFYFHSAVKRLDTIAAFFEEIGLLTSSPRAAPR